MTQYHTTAAYVSGAICGRLWMPGVSGGTPFIGDIRRKLHQFSTARGTTFRDVLLHMLMEHGGDFQNAAFAEDTVIRVERICTKAKYRTVHVWERFVADLPDCEDLVHHEMFVSDFIND